MLSEWDITAVPGEIEGCVRFGVFAIAIGELAREMRHVAALGPGLPQICAYRPRRSPNLARKRVPFLWRKMLRQFKYAHGKSIRLPINPKLFRRFHSHSVLLMPAPVLTPDS